MKRIAVAVLLAVAALAGGCEAAVSSALGTVACEQENRVGAPACPDGQVCAAGTCTACRASERCGNGIDDDCNGKVDDGCGESGAAGGPFGGGGGGATSNGGFAGEGAGQPGTGGATTGGSAGNGGRDFGGSAGNAGTGGGEAGQGGGAAAGDGGSGGSVAGAGTGGAPLGGSGGSAGTSGGGGAGGGPVAASYGDDCSSGQACPTDATCVSFSALGLSASGMVCTKPCCSSADCGPATHGAVCFATSSGTGTCLLGSSVSRASIGSGKTGSTCGSDADCRSGWCDPGGFCNDTCCSDTPCQGAQKFCVSTTLDSPARNGYVCGDPPGSTQYQQMCGGDSDCRNGACVLAAEGVNWTYFCSKPCCNSDSCGSVNVGLTTLDVACKYVQGAGSDTWLRTCAYASTAGSELPVGAQCSADSDCRGNKCIQDSGGNYCSDACCSDNDCGGTGSGFRCLPLDAGMGTDIFRCIRSP